MNQAWLGLHKKLPLATPCFCKCLLDNDLWITTVARAISFIPPSHVWTIIPEICYSNLSHYAPSVTTISMTIAVDSGAASSVTFSKHRLWHIWPPEAPHCRSGRLGRRPSSRQVVLTLLSRLLGTWCLIGAFDFEEGEIVFKISYNRVKLKFTML